MECARKNTSNPESKRSDMAAPREGLLLFEAGPLPEGATGPLRRYQPDFVLFIDSADMGEAPGTIRRLDPEQAEGFTGSTHTFPIGGLAKYLAAELKCEVAVLGIQPKNLEFDSPVSEEVIRAVDEIAVFLNSPS